MYRYRNLATGEIIESVVKPRKLKPFLEPYYDESHPPDQLVFVRRGGGMGDVVTTLGTVQAARKQYPNANLVYCGSEPYISLLDHHPDLDEILDIDEIGDNLPDGKLILFSNPCPASAYEFQFREKCDKSRIELFGLANGIKAEVPRLYTTPEEDAVAVAWLRTFIDGYAAPFNKPCVGVVARTAVKWRDYGHLDELLKELCQEDITLVVIDHEWYGFESGNDARFEKRAGDMVVSTRGVSMRDTMCIVKQLDLLITPDTGWLHVAGALGVPTLGLFGSMDPLYRLAPYGRGSKRAHKHQWLSGDCPYDRQPCWYDICCHESEIPPCLDIDPAKVVKRAMEMLTEKEQLRNCSDEKVGYGGHFPSQTEKKIQVDTHAVWIRTEKAGDYDVVNEVYHGDCYRIRSLATHCIPPPKVVFDIGGHIGMFSLLVKTLFPEAEVFFFEPHPRCFELAMRNLEGIEGIHLYNAAVRYDGIDSLWEAHDKATGGNFIATHASDDRFLTATVDVMTLEAVIESHGIGSIDLIKFDCEGSEMDILASMGHETVMSIKRLVGEYHRPLVDFATVLKRRFPHHQFQVMETGKDIGLFFTRNINLHS